MIILRTKEAVKSESQLLTKHGLTIGFVPTMGALHEGHLELVKKAIENSDVVIVSIFVNPIQFNQKEDFEKYPKNLDKDLGLLENSDVRYVFVPDIQEIYPDNPGLRMDFGRLEQVMEGAFRPGHFSGVGIVVSKLLNIVKPHKVFFGQKDLQQVAVIRKLVVDLSFDVEITVVDTVRESDGLAMSSRNMRLDPVHRQTATVLFRALSFARKELLEGGDWLAIRRDVVAMFAASPETTMEYFELVASDSMAIVSNIDGVDKASICTAAYVGGVRLIDNISVNH